jgi:hypothetical protein
MKYREFSMKETAVAWGNDSLVGASPSTYPNSLVGQRCPVRRRTRTSRFAPSREYACG